MIGRLPVPPATALAVTCAVTAGGPAPTFSDRTEGAGLAGAVQTFPVRVAADPPDGFGVEDYLALRPMIGGGAVGDFDRDGWPDILFLAGGGAGPDGAPARDRLYMNGGDGTFTDRAAAWGVDRAHVGVAAAVGDVDGDGWLDVFVTSLGPAGALGPGRNLLYRNTGRGTFEEVGDAAGLRWLGPDHADGMGAAFGDYDGDGDLDLFVAAYRQLPPPAPPSNRLFRNEGGVFVDAGDDTDLEGLFFGFVPRFVDMDADARPDLLLVGDFGYPPFLGAGSRYFDNVLGAGVPGPVLRDVIDAAGAGLDENGMGHAVSDLDGDGRLDWFVTSIYGDVHPNRNGNKLYLADGLVGAPPFAHAHFTEQAAAANVDDGGWGWGTVAVDVDHDGRPDLVEVNGWALDGEEWIGEAMYLYHNAGTVDGQLTFDVPSPAATGLDHAGQGRGLARLDYDRDGDQDLLVFTNGGGLRLYRNEIAGPQAGWLVVHLDGAPATPPVPPDGAGAIVTVTVDGLTQRSVVDAGSGYLAQSELSAHFGLGAAARVDTLRVDWPGGASTAWTDVPGRRILRLGPVPADVDRDGTVGMRDLLRVLARWGPCPACAADVDLDADVGTADLMAVLDGWR